MTEARAPLVATDLAPAPANGAAEWFRAPDGARLRAAIFTPQDAPRGSVVLSPGRTEPIDKYFEVIGELQARGFVVLAHDWRGQGLSDRLLPDRLKGHARGANLFLGDYRGMLDHFETRLPKPWIQTSHSMGGALALAALAKGEMRFSGSALSSPMLGMVTRGYGYAVARTLTFAAAHLGLGRRYLFGDKADPFTITFEKDRLGHDAARWRRYQSQLAAEPDLALGNLTWAWLEFAFGLTAWLRRSSAVARLRLPVLIVAAGDDDRVLTSDTRKVAARLPNCTYVEIPNAYHEILMETDDIRRLWWEAFDAFAEPIAPRA